ncbi:IucA/IucC family protein [Thermobispora bispora]|uniref:IucA/IucC family protein n=1 Tax=Thermobispora bispora (strain ATCC 19993 / DSM 43833 / CBS 139.67 / JCM 10125 / KCTC 9307 / NBRC 14880 / R51) TaxID=469371 RepID=D6Y7F8_THEBD|nr:IucA/IucC family protein [Thermobispora bispora]ADG89669.1 IucA/IucC family protein [Thermobispora bispora DSM 43833]MBO2475519.1 iron transporter [Actinomycetales bacterium]MBX6168476.1 iron transporter [Thermobispora bispora]MDI9579976.1 IucA/IucC family protein [Thermobispora sp.]
MSDTVRARHLALAEEATVAALLRCCIREIAGPRGRVRTAGPYLTARIAGTPVRTRAGGGIALRFTGPAELLEGGSWRRLTSAELVGLIERELGAGGEVNDEFGAQVAASRDAIAALLAARERADPPADPWLASEQALVTGHPFHPSPKAGVAAPGYAPEAHARFRLRLLGVRADLVAEGGDTAVLDRLGLAPPGYVPLPAHPWQLELLAPDLAGPLADGRLIDLGHCPGLAVPTSSVRTVYHPGTGVCLKFSLNVRITNCVRKNAWYELAGAVELTRRLRPVFDELAGRHPGTRWLPEPGYRSAALGTRLLEGLGVIVRSAPWQVCGAGVTPLLAGALAAPPYGPAASAGAPPGVPEAVRARRAADPVTWWRAYVERVVPPVLDAYADHGVVLEPHLQNVLIGVDADALPAEVIFRDLEGTKLVAGRHDLSGLPARVAAALTYEPERGWNRMAYCLVVNHLAEVAATVAASARDARRPEHRERLLGELWAVAAEVVARHAGGRPPVRELLSRCSLPAKANLGVRWRRAADRAAGYVPVPNPFVRAGSAGRSGKAW